MRYMTASNLNPRVDTLLPPSKSDLGRGWLLTVGFFFLSIAPQAANGQAPPGASKIAELSVQWVDPVTVAPPRTTYNLFETTARGEGTQGSYLISLLSKISQNMDFGHDNPFRISEGVKNFKTTPPI